MPSHTPKERAKNKPQKDGNQRKATKVGPVSGPTPNTGPGPTAFDSVESPMVTEGWRGPMDPDAGMTTKRK